MLNFRFKALISLILEIGGTAFNISHFNLQTRVPDPMWLPAQHLSCVCIAPYKYIGAHCVGSHFAHESTYLATWRGTDRTLFLINELVG